MKQIKVDKIDIINDIETPVSAYLKLSKNAEKSFLLESVEKGTTIGRYSIIGIGTNMIFKSKGQDIIIDKNGTNEKINDDPLEFLKEYYSNITTDSDAIYTGGGVGYFSYDSIRLWENIPNNNPDVIDIPEIYLMFPDVFVIFDHLKHTISLITNHKDENSGKKLEKYKSLLLSSQVSEFVKEGEKCNYESNFTEEKFEKIVEKSKEYIKEGDIFQVVPSQRLSTKIKQHPFDIYRRLRVINPSPYMFYLDFGDMQLVGSSPEMLVKKSGERVFVRPIAGTRKRGKTKEEDEAMEKELITDKKELAEHTMLVDLARNDLGKISKYGTVRVTEEFIIEKYSHVIHIVSEVEGISDRNAVDVFKAAFPAGTVSGAPKIRAMEIINEFEPDRRGVYAGAVGYIDYTGNMDTCIAIRTMIIKDSTAYLQAGAGIVIDSIPRLEYKETINKLKVLMNALEGL